MTTKGYFFGRSAASWRGRRAFIRWREPAHDWHWWRVLEVKPHMGAVQSESQLIVLTPPVSQVSPATALTCVSPHVAAVQSLSQVAVSMAPVSQVSPAAGLV